MPSLYPHEIKKITQGAGAASGFAGFFLPSLRARGLGEEKPVPPYSAIVYKEGDEVRAEDWKGRKIASGEAGVDDASVIQSAINLVHNSGGGLVKLRGNVFTVRKQFTVPNLSSQTYCLNIPSGIELCGEGIGETIIRRDAEVLAKNELSYILHSPDNVKAEYIFIHDLTLDGNYDAADRPQSAGAALTNADNAVFYRVEVKNARAGIAIAAKEKGTGTRHDDYDGYKAILNCIADYCSGEVFSVSGSTHGILAYNLAKNLFLFEIDGTARWCQVLNAESAREVQIINNKVLDLPVETTSFSVLGINMIGGVRKAIVKGNRIEFASFIKQKNTHNIICWELSASVNADVIIENNIFKYGHVKMAVGGGGIASGFTIANNIFDDSAIYITADGAFRNINICSNTFRLSSMDYHAIDGEFGSSGTLAENIVIADNVMDASALTPTFYSGFIRAKYVNNLIIKGNVGVGNNFGILVADCDNVIISENIIRDAGQAASTAGRGIQAARSTGKIINNIIDNAYENGIRLGDATDVLLKGNRISDSGTADLYIDGGTKVAILDNYLLSATPINIASYPTTLIIKRNVGYATENSGTATFSGDGSTAQFSIAHGLVSEPSKVQVTPMTEDAAGDFYVTKDSTNIYVNYLSAPPSGSNNVKLSWYAEV